MNRKVRFGNIDHFLLPEKNPIRKSRRMKDISVSFPEPNNICVDQQLINIILAKSLTSA